MSVFEILEKWRSEKPKSRAWNLQCSDFTNRHAGGIILELSDGVIIREAYDGERDYYDAKALHRTIPLVDLSSGHTMENHAQILIKSVAELIEHEQAAADGGVAVGKTNGSN